MTHGSPVESCLILPGGALMLSAGKKSSQAQAGSVRSKPWLAAAAARAGQACGEASHLMVWYGGWWVVSGGW